MGARGRRGLLAGLESLAASTGRIAERGQRRQQLAMEQAQSEREERRLAAQLEEMDREKQLSELLARARKDARARSVLGLTQSGALSDALGPAYMAALEAELPAEALSRLLTREPSAANLTVGERLLGPEESARMLRERHAAAIRPPTEPRPRYQTSEEILAALGEQAAAKRSLTQRELDRITAESPAVEPLIKLASPQLTPGLSRLLAEAEPAHEANILAQRQKQAEGRASELLRAGLAGAGAPASRVGLIEPGVQPERAAQPGAVEEAETILRDFATRSGALTAGEVPVGYSEEGLTVLSELMADNEAILSGMDIRDIRELFVWGR